MAHKIDKLVAVVALIFMLGGCQAMTGRTAGQNIDDSNTTAAVKARLAQDKISSLTRIDVDTKAVWWRSTARWSRLISGRGRNRSRAASAASNG